MLRVFTSEVKHLWQNKWKFASLIVIVCLPFLFAFLQVSANWNPLSHLDKLRVGIVNKDDVNDLAQRITSNIIAGGKNLRLNGVKKPISINIVQLPENSDPNDLLLTQKYDAIYTVPKGFGDDLIKAPATFFNNQVLNFVQFMDKPNFLSTKIYQWIKNVVEKGITNLGPLIQKEWNTRSPNVYNETTLFLLGFLVRNSLYSPNTSQALKKFKTIGVQRSALLKINNTLSDLTYNKTYLLPQPKDQPINIFTPAVLKYMPYLNGNLLSNTVNVGFDAKKGTLAKNNLLFPMLNGFLKAVLQVNPDGAIPYKKMFNFQLTKKIKFSVSQWENPAVGTFFNLINESKYMLAKIFNFTTIRIIATDIGNKISPTIHNPVGQLLQKLGSGVYNFLEGDDNSITKALYPTSSFEGKMVNTLVQQILSPVLHINFMFPVLNAFVKKIFSENLQPKTFKNPIVIFHGGDSNKYGVSIAPTLMVLGVWLGLFGLLFLVKNDRKKAVRHSGTFANYFGKSLLWITVGVIQSVVVVSSMILLGLRPIGSIVNLFAFFILAAIIFAFIAQAIGYAGRAGEMGLIFLGAVFLAQCASTYGVLPSEIQIPFFRFLNALSPTTYVINGLHKIMVGAGMVQALETLWPLAFFVIIVPFALWINHRFDQRNLRKFGFFPDFVKEIEEE